MHFDVYFMASVATVYCHALDPAITTLDAADPANRELAVPLWMFQSLLTKPINAVPYRKEDLSLMSCRPFLQPHELDSDEFNSADLIVRGSMRVGMISTGQLTRGPSLLRFLTRFVLSAEQMPEIIPRQRFANTTVFRSLANEFRKHRAMPVIPEPLAPIDFNAIKLCVLRDFVGHQRRYNF